MAGTVPVEPAAITGPAGGATRRRSASKSMSAFRRAVGETSLLGKMRRPMLGDDLEELDRVLPVGGVFLRRELFESGEVNLFAFDEVHEVAEVGGEIRGLRRVG